jgi:L,D-transpeptidase YcbB
MKIRTPLGVAIVAALAAARIASAQPLEAPLTSEEIAAIRGAVESAPTQGLPAAELPAHPSDADWLAAILAYAKAQHGQSFAPNKMNPAWNLEPDRFDAEQELAAARADHRLNDWIDGLAPSFAGYKGLVEARKAYAAIIEAGGWPEVKLPVGARLGAYSGGVAALRKRLSIEGFDGPAAGRPQRFDAPLETALKKFQAHRGLPETGVVDEATLEALNESAEQVVDRIDANLERWRWLPRSVPADRITVNIPAFELSLTRNNETTQLMRVVVGKPDHPTPIFHARAYAVVVDPPWNVPKSIAEKELFPKEAAHPGYLRRNGYTVVNGQIRQAFSNKSALGKIKIDLDDPYAVYLHDTPERNLFNRTMRALSHGCVRMHHPEDVAVDLLTAQGVTLEDLQTAEAANTTKRISLKTTIPVYILYRTAVANEDGSVSFLPDVYKWDPMLVAAIQGRLHPGDVPAMDEAAP